MTHWPPQCQKCPRVHVYCLNVSGIVEHRHCKFGRQILINHYMSLWDWYVVGILAAANHQICMTQFSSVTIEFALFCNLFSKWVIVDIRYLLHRLAIRDEKLHQEGDHEWLVTVMTLLPKGLCFVLPLFMCKFKNLHHVSWTTWCT